MKDRLMIAAISLLAIFSFVLIMLVAISIYKCCILSNDRSENKILRDDIARLNTQLDILSRENKGLNSHIKDSSVESLQLSFELENFTKRMNDMEEVKPEDVKRMLFELLGKLDKFCKSVARKSENVEGNCETFIDMHLTKCKENILNMIDRLIQGENQVQQQTPQVLLDCNETQGVSALSCNSTNHVQLV
ncbi:hypothetical protein [Ehrlichia canis]|uniref:Uncharacterized protein n=1 Tax=Ehrlichia canis (strain Jake) TaxID=269484 RepID=A0ACA6AWH0_EHRCJ|nr:hypothetical protein [Ehrlichia canis]AAZ68757.1 hypothetical protein Ecaj_0725 [Ehrlichia canis str. Jake]AUO54514.1 hypothetical protein C1I72_01165 [Ehrlichia canis]UKC53614.1 hypothetical protein s20019040002_000657 [Ehrlichia canis]UKC54552.1 hypothetical protein s20026770001_000658 [Ehrlichia canis]UKC55488.1 hypothetical protein s21009500007_000658 [Ehrlichia canis]